MQLTISLNHHIQSRLACAHVKTCAPHVHMLRHARLLSPSSLSSLSPGILSDSFNFRQSDSFPCEAVRNMTVVEDDAGIDEGRAMAELICFVAPGGWKWVRQQNCDRVLADWNMSSSNTTRWCHRHHH